LNVHAFGSDAVEIEATLSATSVDSQILDSLVDKLSKVECISQVFWSSGTSD